MRNHRAFIISILVLVLAGAGVLAWRLSSNNATSPQNGSTTTQTTKQPVSPPPASGTQPSNLAPKTYLVKVYFSKHPDSDNDPSLTFPVSRTSASLGVARFALSELLKGPTASEQAKGYFTTARLREATSTCNGQDFNVVIVSGVATLTFCRPFDHLGVVADGQAKSEIEATLDQFASVKKVVILNSSGNCEFDLSGMNLCKQ